MGSSNRVDDLKGWRAGDGVKMPPDLSEAARSRDALPTQSCREARHNTGIAGGAENLVSNNGSGGQFHLHHSQVVGSEAGISGSGCSDTGAEAQVPTHFINMYYLVPALRDTFASVGATDRAYSFKEILLFLKNYLFRNLHLFDPVDKLFVNCGNDPLGQALQVNRFHYDEVKPLMSKHVITAQPKPCYNVNREHASVVVKENERHVSTRCVTNVRTVLMPSGTLTLDQETRFVQQRTPVYDPIPGPSRDSTLIQRTHRPATSVLSCTITIPDIPDSNSDAESVYSVQGYETAFCRNTEFEESEDEEEVDSETFEEYELASDDAKVEECSDDNDSVIEDVEVAAVLAFHALYKDEEDFWADDSDLDDQSIDNDPELVAERWDCLSCGLKNKPFVRYCGKCWQLRKNWLPDRPKKRKRKPRPKKRHSRCRSESVKSTEQSSTNVQENIMMISKFSSKSSSRQQLEVLGTSSVGSAISHSDGECSDHSTNEENKIIATDSHGTYKSNQELKLPGVSSNSSTVYNSSNQDVEHNINPQESKITLTDSTSVSDNTQELEVLSRTSSSASTISFRSDSPDRKYPQDCFSSQDSGISSSQGSLNYFSEDFTVKTHLQVEETLPLDREESFSIRGGCTTAINKTKVAEVTDETASSSRKRKSSTSLDMKNSKRLKSLEEDDFNINDIDVKDKAKGFGLFLRSSAGHEWLKSPDGKLFQSSLSVQEVLMEVIEANRSTGSSGYESHEQASGLSNVCSICCLRPKNASIVHGRLTHQATCYQCARRLLDTGSRCPVCRRKIHMVCKHIIA